MKRLLAIIATVGVFSFANADDAQAANDSKVYVNLNTGIGKLYNLPTGQWTMNLNAGYNFNQNFALEGGYNLFTGTEFGATSMTNIVDVAAKGTLPLSPVFSLYGRAGVGIGNNGWSGTVDTGNEDCIMCNKSLDSTYGLGLVGLGGSFALDKHWDLRVEDTLYFPFTNTYTGTMMAFTFGTQYNF